MDLQIPLYYGTQLGRHTQVSPHTEAHWGQRSLGEASGLNHWELQRDGEGGGAYGTRAQIMEAQVAACSKVQCSSRDPRQLPCTI